MGMSSLIYGFRKQTFRNNSTPETAIAMQVMCAIIIVVCMFGPLTSLCSQIVGSFPWIFKRFEKDDLFEEEQEEQRQEQMSGKA